MNWQEKCPAYSDRYSDWFHIRVAADCNMADKLKLQEVVNLGVGEHDKTALTKAARKVQQAIRSGKLKRGEYCFVCGELDYVMTPKGNHFVQAHHFDYTQPLSIIWLCVHCHNMVHFKLEHGYCLGEDR